MSKMFLLRFDDLCPTMKWRTWDRIEKELIDREIKPILAVVPDNRDPSLMIDPPVSDFWERMRRCRDRGWTMALHGYQHCYVTEDAGLVGRRKKSEFSGLPSEKQEEKMRLGIEILRYEGIEPKVWIAPGHTFDATTISILKKHHIDVISDGFFRYPRRTEDGMLWLPMQLCRFLPVPHGTWTICYHFNHWVRADLDAFCRDLDRHRYAIVSFQEVVAKFGNRQRQWHEFVYSNTHLVDVILRIWTKLWIWYETHMSHR